METIVGLLFLLLPVIFKVIGKRLEQAGKVDQAKTARDIFEALGGGEDDVRWKETPLEEGEPVVFSELEVKPQPVPVMEPKVIPAAKAESFKVFAATKKAETPKVQPILMEEKEEKGEKIDPKKLVIYSEIMKTKF